LRAGFAVLDAGGTSLDAVTVAVQALEDDTLFNAGRGPCSRPTACTNSTRRSWTAATCAPAR